MIDTTHTNDIGIAIRDALDQLPAIEKFDWSEAEARSKGWGDIADIDVSDASNPVITTGGGERFQISIVRIG